MLFQQSSDSSPWINHETGTLVLIFGYINCKNMTETFIVSDLTIIISNLIVSSPVQFVFFTGGIVFLTLIVNGSTTQFVLRMLDMDKLSAAKVQL